MIATDTSSLIAFLSGEDAPDTDAIERALAYEQLVLPPAVLTETLSNPNLKVPVMDFLSSLPILEMHADYWLNAATARRTVLQLKRKANLGDALITQSCIDHDVALITRDQDFRHYAKHCGLKLYDA